MDAALAALLDANLVEAAREFARWQVGGTIVERDGLLAIGGTTSFPVGYANVAMRADPSLPAADVIARCREFFAGRRRGFTLFTRGLYDRDLEAALERAGVAMLSDTPCMVIENRVDAPPLGSGCTLRRVRTEADAADAAAINAEAYESLGLPEAETRALYGRPGKLLAPHLVTCLGILDGRAVSTAMILETAGVAGVYWVGTASGGRRSGLAAACTADVTNEAFTRGARAVTLQASAMGEPIYRRLGYRTFDRMRWFVFPA